MCENLDSTTIDLTADMQGFFRTALSEAVRDHALETSDAVEAYLVGLLVDHARPGERGQDALERPLTFLLEDALQSAGAERFERLRVLGDTVLYTNGFFADRLERRGVPIGYVNALGAKAYSNAAKTLNHSATLAGTGDSGAPDLFVDLAKRFPTFVKLLGAVADQFSAGAAAASDRAAVDLYERWLKKRSAALTRALSAQGILPTAPDGVLH